MAPLFSRKSKGATMNPLKNTLPLLGQLVKCVPPKLADVLARKYKIQTRSFSPTSHVVSMMYAQLSHALSLNDVCDALRNHQSNLSQIRNCVPPSRNGLSHANRTRNADMSEELFWTTLQTLKDDYPEFMTEGRYYPGLPHRFTRTIHAVDSSTIQLVANCMGILGSNFIFGVFVEITHSFVSVLNRGQIL